jgi:hypothetical protein
MPGKAGVSCILMTLVSEKERKGVLLVWKFIASYIIRGVHVVDLFGLGWSGLAGNRLGDGKQSVTM